MVRKLFVMILGMLVLLSFNSSPSFAYDKEISSLSSAMATGMDKVLSRKRVAVADFTDQKGEVTELGRMLADDLSMDLAKKTKDFELLDRLQFKNILNDNKIQVSDIVNFKAAQKVGQTAKVGAVVTGSYTVFSGSLKVTVQLISTYIPKVVASSKADISKTKRIVELLEKDMPAAGPADASKTAPARGKQVAESKGFVFELKGCRLAGREVVCGFSVTNNGSNEVRVYLEPACNMYDDLGNSFGLNKRELGATNSAWHGDYVYSDLVPGSPVDGGLVFGPVARDSKQVNLGIEISDRASKDNAKAVFRNLPLK